VRRHPQRSATDADLKEQFDLAIRIRDKVSEANNAVIQIRSLKQQIEDRATKASTLKAAGDALASKLTSVEEEIYQAKNQSGQDPLNFPIKINNRIASLNRVVNSGDGKPIGAAYEIFKDVTAELKVQTDRLGGIVKSDVASFNTELKKAGLAPLDPAKPLDPPRETTAPAAGSETQAAQQPATTQPKIDEFKMITYQAVFLKKGPQWSADGNDLLREIADQMVRRGTLAIAGGIAGDSELRGVYILNGTPEQAKTLVDADPGVKSGRLTYEILPWFGPEGWFQAPPRGSRSETVYFGFLVTGPNRSQSQEEAQKLQRAHLDYMDGQAKIGKLILAGPLNAPQTNKRGLIAYRETDLKTAIERASEDPMVKAGRLAVELYEWRIPRGVLK
jgi:uncharacterized protein YciI